MQYNLVNDQEKVAQFVWRGVAWRGVAWRCVSIRVHHYFGGVPAAFFSACMCYLHVRLFRGSSHGQGFSCTLCVHLRMSSWFCLA